VLTPLGFAFRLVRAKILLWSVALFSIGAMYGSVMGDIESFTLPTKPIADAGGHRLLAQSIGKLYAMISAYTRRSRDPRHATP
jgi:ABC-2 type transport system permease protein